jgi:Ni/Co efflux regulator RcnB
MRARSACLAVVAAMAVPAAGAATSGAAQPGKAGGFQGEEHSHAHKDAREGRTAPSARQRSAAGPRG